MDFILHGLYGLTLANIIYKTKKSLLIGFILGLLPDIGGIFWIYFRNQLIPIDQIPNWASLIYNSTHNLLANFIVFLIIYLFLRQYVWLSLAYTWHLLLDISMHCGKIATKLFFPFSSLSYCSPLYNLKNLHTIQGFLEISINPYIEIFQYLLLFLLNFAILKKRNKSNSNLVDL